MQNVRFQNLAPGGEMRIDTELRADGDHEINPSNKICRVNVTVNDATPDGATYCGTRIGGERAGFRRSASTRVENKGCPISTWLANAP